jgi:tetratricopeptide (TPR) repeat protein
MPGSRPRLRQKPSVEVPAKTGQRKVDIMLSCVRNLVSCALMGSGTLAISAATGWAQPPSLAERCSDRDDDPDDRIAACTSLLNSGRTLGRTLAGAYMNRGAAYARKSQYDRAVADYSAAIRSDPKNPKAYRGRANAYARMSKFDQAIDDADRAIKLDAAPAMSYNLRGLIYADKREHDRAIADFSQAIRLAPQNATPLANRALAYNSKGDMDRCAGLRAPSVRSHQ